MMNASQDVPVTNDANNPPLPRRLSSVRKNDDGTIVESRALWNNAKGRDYPDGTGIGVDFNPGSVRDTFKGRLHGFFNRVKRELSRLTRLLRW